MSHDTTEMRGLGLRLESELLLSRVMWVAYVKSVMSLVYIRSVVYVFCMRTVVWVDDVKSVMSLFCDMIYLLTAIKLTPCGSGTVHI